MLYPPLSAAGTTSTFMWMLHTHSLSFTHTRTHVQNAIASQSKTIFPRIVGGGGVPRALSDSAAVNHSKISEPWTYIRDSYFFHSTLLRQCLLQLRLCRSALQKQRARHPPTRDKYGETFTLTGGNHEQHQPHMGAERQVRHRRRGQWGWSAGECAAMGSAKLASSCRERERKKHQSM